MGNESKSNKTKAVIITALLVSGALFTSTKLYMDKAELQEINAAQSQTIESLNNLKADLEKELKFLNAEILKHKGKNEELDHLLTEAQSEIKAQKLKIEKLLKENASVKSLKKQLAELKSLNFSYLAKIRDLEVKIETITSDKEKLIKDNTRLQEELSQYILQNENLNKKVMLASALKTKTITTYFEAKDKHGKYVKVKKSKQAERIVLNLTLEENKVADKGEKNIHVRIIDAKGKTLPASENEEGSFVNPDNNMTVPYSKHTKVSYHGETKSAVLYDIKGDKLSKGVYSIEVYCDQQISGKSKLIVK